MRPRKRSVARAHPAARAESPVRPKNRLESHASGRRTRPTRRVLLQRCVPWECWWDRRDALTGRFSVAPQQLSEASRFGRPDRPIRYRFPTRAMQSQRQPAIHRSSASVRLPVSIAGTGCRDAPIQRFPQDAQPDDARRVRRACAC